MHLFYLQHCFKIPQKAKPSHSRQSTPKPPLTLHARIRAAFVFELYTTLTVLPTWVAENNMFPTVYVRELSIEWLPLGVLHLVNGC